MPDIRFAQDMRAIASALNQQYHQRNKDLQTVATQENRRQQFEATVVGFDRVTGQILVQVNGGVVPAIAQSDGFQVGAVVSYYLPRGAAVGFVDRKVVG